jgi:hypothetical protein
MSGVRTTGGGGSEDYLAWREGRPAATFDNEAPTAAPTLSDLDAAFDAVEEISHEAAEAGREALGSGGDGGGAGGRDGSGGERPGQNYEGVFIWRVNEHDRFVRVLNTLPEDCPVQVLGTRDNACFFLDTHGQLKEIPAKGWGQADMELLFGTHQEFLLRAWPQVSVAGVGENMRITAKGYHLQYARQVLIQSAAREGIFDAEGRVRGRGAWLDDDGKLVLHVGDALISGEKTIPPGKMDRFVYPARPPVPRPVAGTAQQFHDLYDRFKSWNFERGERDARLLLGWMGTAVLSGALNWRPMVFILGDAAAGKSSLQKEVRGILEGRIKGTVEATPAALRALMGQDAMAISFDELEADGDDRSDKAAEVMKLARFAASGDTIYRGTKDQGVNEFKLQGGMLFSAINPPVFRQQDMQRFCFLKVNPFKAGGASYKPPKVKDQLALGQALAGRMVAGWQRWEATLDCYHELLMEQGHSTRGADNFGALLAAADILLHDELDPNRAFELAKAYPRHGLVEYENVEQNFAKYWRLLLTAQPDAWRTSGNEAVGEVLGRWLRHATPAVQDQDGRDACAKLKVKLERCGLSVVQDRKANNFWLAIPNDHPQTKALFVGTDLSRGGWMTALRYGSAWSVETPNNLWRTQQVNIAGGRVQCTLINLTADHDFGDGKPKPLFVVESDDDK